MSSLVPTYVLYSHRCLKEVNERIESLQLPPGMAVSNQLHEDHDLFKEMHDEQLLLWTQRLGVAVSLFKEETFIVSSKIESL